MATCLQPLQLRSCLINYLKIPVLGEYCCTRLELPGVRTLSNGSDSFDIFPGAYEGFCLGGGTICARKRAKKIFWSPPLATLVPPLKNPFFEKILIPFFYFFCPPSPTWTYFVHHKNTPKRLLFWVLLTLESKNYSFA